jgi:hypothetical protein
MQGTETGNWLNKSQAQRTTLKGRRDRAIMAVMTGCGLRREEVAQLEFECVQQRDGRWCIVDIRGKHGRIRTVPMPALAKTALDEWAAAAEISEGAIFRGVNKRDRMTGDSLTSQGIWCCVEKYSSVAPQRSAEDVHEIGLQERGQAQSDPAEPRTRLADDNRAVSGRAAGSARRALRLPQARSVGGMGFPRKRTDKTDKTGFVSLSVRFPTPGPDSKSCRGTAGNNSSGNLRNRI